jgi:hypothetical protein
MQSDKIRILLVDDRPEGFFDPDIVDVTLPAKYARYFNLYWIQKPEEARWLIDTYNEIYIKAPEHLINIGLPPEIVIFDYALTQASDRCPKRDSQKSNIIKQTQDYIQSKGIKIEIFSYSGTAPSTGTLPGSDRMGCYIGGMFARTFSDYPCGAIPTTAHVDTSNTDAAFFEWLNEKYLDNAFFDKSRPKPTWEELINAGVNAVRKKIIKLSHANLIRIKLDELQLLSSEPVKIKSLYLSIYSKLGCRKIPIEGLFIDTSEDQNEYEKTAKEWSGKVLESLFQKHNPGDFYDARTIANTYFDAFLLENSSLRYELADLVAKSNRDYNDKDRLSELCDYFSINKNESLTNPQNVKVQGGLGLWNKTARNDYVARWSVLMLIVKAEQFYRQYSPEFERVKQYEVDGEIDFKKLINSCVSNYGEEEAEKKAKEEANRLVKSLGMYKLENSANYELATARMASVDDVLTLLDPIPEKLLTHFNKGKDFKKDATTITNALKRLKSGDVDIGLNINSVLTEQSEGGLIQGEGNLLRLYANEIGYDEKGWSSWLKSAQ